MVRVVMPVQPAAGHVNQIKPIGADLVRRGHDVTFVTGSVFRESVERAGMAFAPWTGIADIDHARAADFYPERLELEPGPQQLGFDIRKLFIDPIPDQFRVVQGLLDDDEPTIVLQDAGVLGTWPTVLGAEGRRPSALLGLGVPPLPLSSVDVAPYGLGLLPDSSPEGRARNREAHTMFQTQVFGPVQEHFEAVLRETGATQTPPFLLDGAVTLPDRFLQLSIEELEYRRSDAPSSLRFVGSPPQQTSGEVELPSWWDDVLKARTVVAVSQGTVGNNDLGELLEPTLQALADLDVLVVATTVRKGARLHTEIPENARVADFISFEALFPHIGVMVSNGGYGTVQQAFRHGVPMVLSGRSEEKIEVTARAAHTGAAVNLAKQRPEPAEIRGAVERVLREPGYREAAERLKAVYDRHDTYGEIAAVVEQAAH